MDARFMWGSVPATKGTLAIHGRVNSSTVWYTHRFHIRLNFKQFNGYKCFLRPGVNVKLRGESSQGGQKESEQIRLHDTLRGFEGSN